MNNINRRLLIEQLDRKLNKLQILKELEVPPKGWINAIRTSLNMSLGQLGRRLKKTPVTIREIEDREMTRSITLKKLIEVGEALDLQFVYGFVPRHTSIENMVAQRAERVARTIVMRTSHTMALEDQENNEERLERAVKDRAELLKREIPKLLWD